MSRKVRHVKPLCFPVPSVCWIYKHRISLDWCDEVVKFADKHANESSLKNVQSFKSTGWHLHNEDGFKELYSELNEIILELLQLARSEKNAAPIIRMGPFSNDFEYELESFWVSWFNENSYTWPHDHFSERFGSIGSYSLAIYLGQDETSIAFRDSLNGDFDSILVTKGDVVFFPSNVPHMSFDVTSNRVIASANIKYKS